MSSQLLLPLTLYWRGLRKSTAVAWELLSMSSKELDVFLQKHPEIPKDWRRQGERDLEWCIRNGYHLVTFFHPNYIEGLRALAHPPWLLTVHGSIANLNHGGITVVGGRNMSVAAAEWMDSEFAEFLQTQACQVISGGARGVDQRAHMVAARLKRPTWAHLPSGFSDIYPENLLNYTEHILDSGGGLISAYSPFTLMEKQNFHERNYNLALHGSCTLIVEAKRRSGTMITAKAALDYGRQLAAVPWGPHPIGMGNLDLLRDGADMAATSTDILQFFQESATVRDFSCEESCASEKVQKEEI